MDGIIFEVISGFLIPRSPVTADGSERVADGIQFLNDVQAAERFNASLDTIRELYARAFDTAAPAPKATDELLRRKYPALGEEHFAEFMARMQAAGLDAWTPDVYPDIRPDDRTGMPRLVITAGVNHFRRVASAHPKYGGQRGPLYCDESEKWTEIWLRDVPPSAAKVGAMVAGQAEPTWAVCGFREYAAWADESRTCVIPSWQGKEYIRLAACAETSALRRAFGDRLGSFYGIEEMAHSRNPRRQIASKVIAPPKIQGLHFVPDDYGPIVPMD